MPVTAALPFLNDGQIGKARAFALFADGFVAHGHVRKIGQPRKKFFAVREVRGPIRHLSLKSLGHVVQQEFCITSARLAVTQVGYVIAGWGGAILATIGISRSAAKPTT